MNNIIIAIDGHSSCGKSTVAKALAQKLHYIYVDTGAMYRAITFYCIKNNLYDNKGIVNVDLLKNSISQINITFKNSNGNFENQETYLNGINIEKEIRSLEVSSKVSEISKLKFVREYLVELQREFGKTENLVMDGRDIGTVVYPNARLKIFMTAQPEVRAKRRYNELMAKGESVSYEAILENVISRDYEDSNRTESPLKQAPDALILDNSNLTREQQLDWILNKLNA
ncbi:MAG: (d)CMP kinase [Bacteroidales bacterium]|nr:(d)CMP kinase [Bacteroidales bacterium]